MTETTYTFHGESLDEMIQIVERALQKLTPEAVAEVIKYLEPKIAQKVNHFNWADQLVFGSKSVQIAARLESWKSDYNEITHNFKNLHNQLCYARQHRLTINVHYLTIENVIKFGSNDSTLIDLITWI